MAIYNDDGSMVLSSVQKSPEEISIIKSTIPKKVDDQSSAANI